MHKPTWSQAVILTALPVEYRAVRHHLGNLKEEVYKGTVYERGIFHVEFCRWEVGILQVGAGNAPTAAEAERAIAYFQPSVVLFVGVAGGLKDVQIGDVVAATKVYGYESGKAGLVFQPRPEVSRSAYRMEQRARMEAIKNNWLQRLGRQLPNSPPRVFVAPIAAGEKVVASTRSSIWRFLTTRYSDAIAVEMEGCGFYNAAHVNQGVDALIVRGISDLIDDKNRMDAAHSQELAARHASAFAFEVLANLCTEELTTASRVRTQSTGGSSRNITIQDVGSIQAPIQVGGINTINNNFSLSPDSTEEGTALLDRGRIAFLSGDYTSAKQYLSKAMEMLSEDEVPEKNAQARYILALAHLQGARPFSVTIEVWERIEELLRTSIRLNPCYSYLYTFALFELDFSRNGWKKAQYKREAQQLMYKASNLPQLDLDKWNFDLFSKSQHRLMQEMQDLDCQ